MIAELEVSAASGLVADAGGRFAVIADDELDLLFVTIAGVTVERVRLFPDEPPLPRADGGPARKLAKPDLEALVMLPDGRLLALGSGSGGLASRRRGVVLARWPAMPVDEELLGTARDAIAARADGWVVLGLLVTDDGTGCIGTVAAADADATAAERLLRDLLETLRHEEAAVEVHRWQRGGRR